MNTQAATPNTEAAILARLIQARDEMSREVALYLLAIELDSYLHVGNLLTIMQSKARVYLPAEERGRYQQ